MINRIKQFTQDELHTLLNCPKAPTPDEIARYHHGSQDTMASLDQAHVTPGAILKLFHAIAIGDLKQAKKLIQKENLSIDAVRAERDQAHYYTRLDGCFDDRSVVVVSPLCHAIEMNQWGIARYLIENGADIYFSGLSAGTRYFHVRGEIPFLNIFNLVITYQLFVNNNKKQGKNYPQLEIRVNDMMSVLRLMIEKKGANLNQIICVHDTDTLLGLTTKRRVETLFIYLLEQGADPNYCGDYHQCQHPLFSAMDNEEDDTTYSRILLALDANVDGEAARRQEYEMEMTPLDKAAKLANIPMLKLLLQFNAKVNHVNYETHKTPIFHALYMDSPQSVRLLIEHGADMTMKAKKSVDLLFTSGRSSYTPLEYFTDWLTLAHQPRYKPSKGMQKVMTDYYPTLFAKAGVNGNSNDDDEPELVFRL